MNYYMCGVALVAFLIIVWSLLVISDRSSPE